MDFKDFCKTELPKEKKNKEPEVKVENFDKKQAEDMLDKYKNYSQSELMEEFLAKTKEQKASGNLTDEKIQQIYGTLSPMLTEEQRKNLDNIMKMMR